MKPVNDFARKQQKYMPTFRKSDWKTHGLHTRLPLRRRGTYARNRIPRRTEQHLV